MVVNSIGTTAGNPRSIFEMLKHRSFRRLKNMKNSIFAVILFLAFSACKNQEINFPDYDYTAGYFTYQYPFRTLVLGNYIYDNTNDNNHKFLISVMMVGVYENKKDRIFKIQVDESLCNNVVRSEEHTSELQ